MTQIFAGFRALLYMTGFVFVWGWLALQVRSIDGGLACRWVVASLGPPSWSMIPPSRRASRPLLRSLGSRRPPS